MKFNNYLQLNEGINDKGIFKACFLCGVPASAKSTTYSKIKSGAIEARVINFDKYFEFFGSPKGDKVALDRSKRLTESQLYLYLNSMLPLLVDGTGAELSTFIRRVGLVESLGYDTMALFCNISLETALKRAKEREEVMGRHVDPGYIVSVHKKLQDNKNIYRSKFGTFLEIDTENGLSDEVIQHSFKKLLSFYSGPLMNPTGQEYIERMKANKDKYLTDSVKTPEFLKKMVSVWFTS